MGGGAIVNKGDNSAIDEAAVHAAMPSVHASVLEVITCSAIFVCMVGRSKGPALCPLMTKKNFFCEEGIGGGTICPVWFVATMFCAICPTICPI